MEPGDIKNANRVLGPPKDLTENEVMSLPVLVEYQHDCEPRGIVMRSAWIPTDEERKMIAEGGCVILSVFGTGHPPVALATVHAEHGLAGPGEGKTAQNA